MPIATLKNNPIPLIVTYKAEKNTWMRGAQLCKLRFTADLGVCSD